jgi:hypothetical protein
MPRSRIASIQRAQAGEIGTWFRGASLFVIRNLLNDLNPSTEFILSAAVERLERLEQMF